jgi:hypothetical protein
MFTISFSVHRFNSARVVLLLVLGFAPALMPEALAQVNLALRKPAQMSSIYPGGYPASNCVDGANSGGLCHTLAEANPWWQVDLQGNYALSHIVVTNRADCCAERARSITALISADGQNWSRIYAHNGSDFQTLRIDAGGRTARFVRVQLASNDYLNLAEVEVYGAAPGGGTLQPPPPPQAQMNLALRKPAQMSSIYSGGYPASNCVDGANSGGLCHTLAEANPWWQVDLQGNYALSHIVVTNRADCCAERARSITALISADGQNWSRIYAHNGSDFQTLRIDAGGRTARFVRVQLASNDYLNLAEVEVYGAAFAGVTPPATPAPGSPAFNLTGRWSANDGGYYYLRQLGNELWWYGHSGDGARTWTNVLYGRVQGNRVTAKWADVPQGAVQGSGDMELEISGDGRQLTATRRSGGFGGSQWTRQ